MPRFDLAGNPLPEPDPVPPTAPELPLVERPAPVARWAAGAAPTYGYAPAPAPAAPPPTAQTILTRGITRDTPAQRVRAYAGLAGAFLALILLTYAVAAIPAPHIPAPTGYAPFSSSDANLSCDAPLDWQRKVSPISISFSRQKARIVLEAPPPQDVLQNPSVAALHAQTQSVVADALADSHFVEQPAQPLLTGRQDALISEWTAAPGLMRLHGFRATLGNGSNIVIVLCECPARDWTTLKPAFLHVIQSIAPVGGSVPMPAMNGGF